MRTRFGVGNAKASDHKAGALLRSHRRITDEISKTSLPFSSALSQPPLALPILGQGLGKSPENPPHRGNPRGNSHSQTAKARDNSRPAPAPNSPVAVPEILCSLFASQNFDRCHSLSSLDPPQAAVASLPNSPKSVLRSQKEKLGLNSSPSRLSTW